MSDKPKNYGMFIAGIVMSKNKYPGRDGKPDRYGIDVAIPGIREMLSISVPVERWGGFLEMQDFQSKVTFRTYKGSVYYELA